MTIAALEYPENICLFIKNVWRSDNSWELETLSHSFTLSLSLDMLYNFCFHVLEDNMNIGASIQQFQPLYSTIRESSWKCQNDFFIPSQLLEKKLATCNKESPNWQDIPIIAVTYSDLMAEPRDKLACICTRFCWDDDGWAQFGEP